MDRYFYSQRFKNILRDYEQCERQGVPCIISAEDYCDIAEYYDDRGDNARAKQVLETAVRLYPDTAEPVIMLARLHMLASNSTAEARHLLDGVADKTEPEYIYTMAEILIMEGETAALDDYLLQEERRLKDDGDPGDTTDDDISDYDYFCMDMVETFLDFNMQQRAEQWLAKVANSSTDEYKELQGRVLLGAGRFDECEHVVNDLLDRDPFSTDNWNTLASSQFLRGDISQSISSSEYSLAIDPTDYSAVSNRGNGLFMLGNYDEALGCYRRLTELRPDEASGHLYQTLCYLNLDDVASARDHLATAMRLKLPDSAAYYSMMIEIATAFGELGCVDDAMSCLDRAEEASGDHLLLSAQCEVARGHVCLQNDDGVGAHTHFNQAVAQSHGSTEVAMRIVASLYDNGMVDGAYGMLKSLMTPYGMRQAKACRSTLYTEGYAYLALCCYVLKKKREFVSNVKKAVEADALCARDIMSDIFPEGTPPTAYVAVARDMPL